MLHLLSTSPAVIGYDVTRETGVHNKAPGHKEFVVAVASRRLSNMAEAILLLGQSKANLNRRTVTASRVYKELSAELKREPLESKSGTGRPLLGSSTSVASELLKWVSPIFASACPGQGTAKVLEKYHAWIEWAEENTATKADLQKLIKIFVHWTHDHDAELDRALWGTCDLNECSISSPPKFGSSKPAVLKFGGLGSSKQLDYNASRVVARLLKNGLDHDSDDESAEDPMDVTGSLGQIPLKQTAKEKRKAKEERARERKRQEREEHEDAPPPKRPKITPEVQEPEVEVYVPRNYDNPNKPAYPQHMVDAANSSKFKGLRKAEIETGEVGNWSIKAYSGCVWLLAEAARELHPECFKPYFTGILDIKRQGSCVQMCTVGVYTSDRLDVCARFASETGFRCKFHHDTSGGHKRAQLPVAMRKKVQKRSLEIAKKLGVEMFQK